jgi:hypothetical protein
VILICVLTVYWIKLYVCFKNRKEEIGKNEKITAEISLVLNNKGCFTGTYLDGSGLYFLKCGSHHFRTVRLVVF